MSVFSNHGEEGKKEEKRRKEEERGERGGKRKKRGRRKQPLTLVLGSKFQVPSFFPSFIPIGPPPTKHEQFAPVAASPRKNVKHTDSRGFVPGRVDSTNSNVPVITIHHIHHHPSSTATNFNVNVNEQPKKSNSNIICMHLLTTKFIQQNIRL